MAGISREEREEKQQIAEIEERLRTHPEMGDYAYGRLQGTLRALRKSRSRRLAERKAKVEADRKAEKATANRPNWPSLPARETQEQYEIRVARQMGR